MLIKETGEIRRILVLVLFANLFVTLLKAVFGIMSNSLSMIADSVHSLFDSTSNVVGIIAIQLASKPPDGDHPYGHRKYETIATLFIALLLMITAFEIVETAFRRLMNPSTPDIITVTYAVMVLTMVINFFVARYEHRAGRRLGSSILVADSLHTRSDIFASLSVLFSFVAVSLGYPMLDSLVAFAIVILISKTALSIIRGASESLCDVCMVDMNRVREVIKSVAGVIDCHKVRARGGTGHMYMDFHILVDPRISLEKGHEISHQVEERLKKSFPGVVDVTVHIEPKR